MKLKSPVKVKQQQRVLLLALYLLKNRFGDHAPEKRKVLRFIRSQNLMHIPEDDELSRSSGESVWENDLAWKREDLKERGFVRMPQRGIWQITGHGERDVEAWAERVKTKTEQRADWEADLKAHLAEGAASDSEAHYEYYITPETIRWALKIAANELH